MGELRSIRVFVLGDARDARLVHGQRPVDDHQCAVRQRRRQEDRLAAQHPAEARRPHCHDAGSLRPAAQGRHPRGRAAAARRRDLHSAGRRDGRPGRRSAPAGDLRAEERDDRRAAVAARRRLDAGGRSDARDARARRRAARSASPSTSILPSRRGGAQALQSGDTLRVPPIRPMLEDSVTLSGYVHRPGEYQFRPGMRIADVIPSLDELKPNADQRYVLVRRELPPDRRIRVFSADLEQALARADIGGELRAGAARSDLRVRSGVRPRPHHRAADARAAHAVAHRRADAGSQRRGQDQGAGQVSARAGHARQRPAARRRQPR